MSTQQSARPAYIPSDLLDTNEAAQYLGIAATTLRNWRNSNQGPVALKIGRRAVRYRFQSLEEFIAESTKAVA